MPSEIRIDGEYAVDGSTYKITMNFTDTNGDAVAPKTLTWSLLDSDEAIVNDRDAVVESVMASTMVVVLSGDDITVSAGFSGLSEDRWFTIAGTYDSDLGTDKPLTDFLRFPVVRVPKKAA